MGVRVHLGDIEGREGVPAGTGYGLWIGQGGIVLHNGATVVIDGTSDMFRILATGTHSVTAAADSGQQSYITLTALGTFTVLPGMLGYVSGGNTVNDNRVVGREQWGQAKMFASGTSGGSPTFGFHPLEREASIFHTLGNGTPVDLDMLGIGMNYTNRSGSSRTAYGRYYALEQTAL